MSKMTEALKKAGEERANIISPVKEKGNFLDDFKTEGKMRKTWMTWGFIIVVVTVFVVFNYQEGKDAVPLSEIFPDEEVFPVDVEYEFVEETTASSQKEKVLPVVQNVESVKSTKTEVINLVTSDLATSDKAATYTIQIASFKDKKRAEDALANIQSKVPSAYIASRDLGKKGIWYRIYAGQFERRSEAEVTLNSIKQNYNSSFIISPKKAE